MSEGGAHVRGGPPAYLALWNGVQSERRAEYEVWHAIEHMPERIGSPGFLGARRYRREDGADYFTLYALADLDALDTLAYRALVDTPTAWSARMRPALTGFRRLPIRTVYACGRGLGGAAATLRVASDHREVLPTLEARIGSLAASGTLLAAIVGAAVPPVKAYAVFPSAPAPGIETLIVLEGTEPEPIAAAADECARAIGDAAAIEIGLWRFLQSLDPGSLEAPDLARQPARTDLMRRWSGADG